MNRRGFLKFAACAPALALLPVPTLREGIAWRAYHKFAVVDYKHGFRLSDPDAWYFEPSDHTIHVHQDRTRRANKLFNEAFRGV